MAFFELSSLAPIGDALLALVERPIAAVRRLIAFFELRGLASIGDTLLALIERPIAFFELRGLPPFIKPCTTPVVQAVPGRQ